jgi:hypothetical protein
MTAAEILALKFQSVLGAKYLVYVNHAFQKEFTNPVQTPYGIAYDVNYQAFDQYVDKIVAMVNVNQTDLASLSYRLDVGTYSIDFWLPVDFIKRSADGSLIEPPKFTFHADAAALKTALTGGAVSLHEPNIDPVTFVDSGVDYPAYFTVSDPTMQSAVAESAGAYKRVVMRITGQFNFADSNLKTGNEIEIRVNWNFGGISREEIFKNISNLQIIAGTEPNDISTAGELKQQLKAAMANYSVSFDVDDFTEDGNGRALLAQRVFFNNTVLQNNLTSSRRNKAQVSIRVQGITVRTFWAILSATYTSASKSTYGRFSVTLTDSGE